MQDYNSAPNAGTAVPADPAAGPDMPAVPAAPAASRRVMPASRLTGSRVRNSAGQDLGSIEAIMIDVPTGRVAYAVLSFGGFLGLGSKLFAVPWEALALSDKDREYTLNIDRKHLEQAPGFDPDRWPDMADRAWASELYRFYGYKPYWEP
jgi:sporulation protein YlmC with PRC-barrel domain